jgi:ABC-type transporter Mla subunit MlaD
MSNNLYTLVDQIADQLESPNYSLESVKPFIDQFTKQSELLSTAMTTSGTKSQFLTSTEERLTDVGDNAADALDEAAYVDTIDAYQNYMTKYYGYQCAMKIGTKLIESTILDYMR